MSRLVLLVLAVALFMEGVGSTVIATSLPAIAADIGTRPVALKLAFTAYFVALAIFISISAWLADRFGAKTALRAAAVVFMLGSLGVHSLGRWPNSWHRVSSLKWHPARGAPSMSGNLCCLR